MFALCIDDGPATQAWRAVEIESGVVTLARCIGEADVRLSLPASAFEGVTLARRGAGYALRLLHREPGLCVTLGAFGRPDAARAAAKICARDLGLSNLAENAAPDAVARRGAGALRSRRRRFAGRRAAPAVRSVA
ncbi:MAG: hypothetical protein KGI57_10600 [Hyphomicrobiales bacterium]|nr:hypothetical protein [Hyphomicrobiales bacterium]MDE2018142.1 hypothetical protein [Hyphomicrobiales bacterium]